MEKLKTFIIAAYLKAQYYIITYLNAVENASKWIVATVLRVDLLDEQSSRIITTSIYILLHITILSMLCYIIF
jgi:hypothetical protein